MPGSTGHGSPQEFLERISATVAVAPVNVPVPMDGSRKGSGGNGRPPTGVSGGGWEGYEPGDQEFAVLKLELQVPCTRAKSSWIDDAVLRGSIALYQEVSTQRVGVVIDGAIKPIDQFAMEGKQAAILVAAGAHATRHLAEISRSLKFFSPLGFDQDSYSLDLIEIWNRATPKERKALFITTAAAARICDVTPSCVRQWAQKGITQFLMIGRRYRIYRPSLVNGFTNAGKQP
jgi:hypothetical protein